MSLSLVQSRALLGLQTSAVTVEVHLANGLPSFTNVICQLDYLSFKFRSSSIQNGKSRPWIPLGNLKARSNERKRGASGLCAPPSCIHDQLRRRI